MVHSATRIWSTQVLLDLPLSFAHLKLLLRIKHKKRKLEYTNLVPLKLQLEGLKLGVPLFYL